MTVMTVAIGTVFVTATAAAAVKPTRISVTRFEDKHARSCDEFVWFDYDTLGSGMQDQLITELSKTDKYAIQERAELESVYVNEHELINANKKFAPKKNKFRAAQYTIVGAITGFEYCHKGKARKVNVGALLDRVTNGLVPDLEVERSKRSAKVILDMRIINVETGEVVKSFAAEGKIDRSDLQISGDAVGVAFGSDDFEKTPLGEAAREAIKNAVQFVITTI